MADIDFPDSPTLGDEFSAGLSTWRWDGLHWNLAGSYGVTGPQGPIGPTGPQGAPSTVTGPTGAAFVFVSDTPPAGATTGQRWFDSSDGRSYTFYDNYWIEQGSSPVYPDANTIASRIIANDFGSSSVIDTYTLNVNDYNRADLTIGLAHFAVFVPLKDLTITTITTWLRTGSADISAVKYGLYEMTTVTSGVLVAETDFQYGGYFADTVTENTKRDLTLSNSRSYPTSYTLTAGQRYAVGILATGSSTNTYQIYGCDFGPATNITFDSSAGVVTAGSVSGMTDLDTPITLTSTSSNLRPFFRLS